MLSSSVPLSLSARTSKRSVSGQPGSFSRQCSARRRLSAEAMFSLRKPA